MNLDAIKDVVLAPVTESRWVVWVGYTAIAVSIIDLIVDGLLWWDGMMMVCRVVPKVL